MVAAAAHSTFIALLNAYGSQHRSPGCRVIRGGGGGGGGGFFLGVAL